MNDFLGLLPLQRTVNNSLILFDILLRLTRRTMAALQQPKSERQDNLVIELDMSEQYRDSEEDSASTASEEEEPPIDPADRIVMTNHFNQLAIRDYLLKDQKKHVGDLKRSRARLYKAHQEIINALCDHTKISERLMVTQKTIGDAASHSNDKNEVAIEKFRRQYNESNRCALDEAFVNVMFDFKSESTIRSEVNDYRVDLKKKLYFWKRALDEVEQNFGKPEHSNDVAEASDSHTKKRAFGAM